MVNSIFQHIEMVFREQNNNEEWFCGFMLWCGGCVLMGLAKENTLNFKAMLS